MHHNDILTDEPRMVQFKQRVRSDATNLVYKKVASQTFPFLLPKISTEAPNLNVAVRHSLMADYYDRSLK